MVNLWKTDEATLYYLFMMADGEITYDEEKLFNAICMELSIDTDEKNDVINRCIQLTSETDNIYNIIIREKLDENIGSFPYIVDDYGRVRILWNLIHLGYIDSNYSEDERIIVDYFVNRWNIRKEIYTELIDTADTMLALTKQKEWLISTFPKGKERDLKEKDIDYAIDKLQADIRLTIEEIIM